MNSIRAERDRSDYEIYGEFLNLKIDYSFIDEKLEELYPAQSYKGLVPTLSYQMTTDNETKIVWERILPEVGAETICPIIMCPDDRDFSCSLLVVKIKNLGNEIIWEKIGIDRTTDFKPERVGTNVEWLDKLNNLRFDMIEYQKMLEDFKINLIKES